MDRNSKGKKYWKKQKKRIAVPPSRVRLSEYTTHHLERAMWLQLVRKQSQIGDLTCSTRALYPPHEHGPVRSGERASKRSRASSRWAWPVAAATAWPEACTVHGQWPVCLLARLTATSPRRHCLRRRCLPSTSTSMRALRTLASLLHGMPIADATRGKTPMLWDYISGLGYVCTL